MAAAWMRARSELRARWRSWLALSLVLGLVGGVAMAALAGARRTDSAYPRFLRSHRADDVAIGVERLNGEEEGFLDAVEALPQVADHTRNAYTFIQPLNAAGEPDESAGGQPKISVDGGWLTRIDRVKVLHGRRPDPTRPDEVAASYSLAQKFHIKVGDHFRVASFSPTASRDVLAAKDVQADGPALTMRVVGIELAPGELAASTGDDVPVHLTPAFFRLYRDRIGTAQATLIRLKHGAADLPGFRAAAERLVNGGETESFLDQRGLTAKTQRSIHVQVLALRLFALLALIAGLVVAAQLIGRQLFVESDDCETLASLGMTRAQVFMASMTRVLVAAIGGGAVAAVLSIALSPLTPVGMARVAESAPGVAVDWVVLAPGVAAFIVLLVSVGLVPAWRTARRVVDRGLWRPSAVAELLARRSFPPSAVAGLRMALERGPGRSAIPIRSTIVGIALAAVTISAVVSFGASLDHLTGTPRLYGWGWDVSAGNPYADDLTGLVLPVLQSDRDVVAYSGASFAPISVDGHSVSALAFDQLKGSVGSPPISGRAPAAADEISMGTRSLRRLHRSVGQTVRVSTAGATRSMRIVGRSVYPAIGPSDAGGVGEGAGLTMAGLRTLVPSAPENLFMIRLGGGADRAAVMGRLRPQLQRAQVTVFTAQRPTDVENYRRVNAVPFALAAFIGALALVTITYLVGVSVRRRRRDLAVLKTLGFVRRQVQVAVVWQATVVAALALLVGIPGGVVAGRWAWRLFAQQQGVLAEPAVPVLLLMGIAAAVLAMANLMAAVPARVASTTHPAIVLRSE